LNDLYLFLINICWIIIYIYIYIYISVYWLSCGKVSTFCWYVYLSFITIVPVLSGFVIIRFLCQFFTFWFYCVSLSCVKSLLCLSSWFVMFSCVSESYEYFVISVRMSHTVFGIDDFVLCWFLNGVITAKLEHLSLYFIESYVCEVYLIISRNI
jgi:hypothetical protein